jgi:hypothetical protein
MYYFVLNISILGPAVYLFRHRGYVNLVTRLLELPKHVLTANRKPRSRNRLMTSYPASDVAKRLKSRDTCKLWVLNHE